VNAPKRVQGRSTLHRVQAGLETANAPKKACNFSRKSCFWCFAWLCSPAQSPIPLMFPCFVRFVRFCEVLRGFGYCSKPWFCTFSPGKGNKRKICGRGLPALPKSILAGEAHISKRKTKQNRGFCNILKKNATNPPKVPVKQRKFQKNRENCLTFCFFVL